MPGASANKMSCRVVSCSKWTLNGTKRMRLQMFSSVPTISGLCCVDNHSFSCGLNPNGSLNLKQALMVSPLVSLLDDSMRALSQLLTLLPFDRAYEPCAPQLGDVAVRPRLHAHFLATNVWKSDALL